MIRNRDRIVTIQNGECYVIQSFIRTWRNMMDESENQLQDYSLSMVQLV